MPPLTIYSASAGSGKTYTLTLSYLEMLFADPEAFRKTLAVTFTNKAAAEMKERILRTLHHLSLKTPESSDIAGKLSASTGRNREEIASMAGLFLEDILSDYSNFYVGTIDKFFQMVLRGFTREAGLQGGYNLELDTRSVLWEATDDLMSRIQELPWLQDWLLDYSRNKLNEGKAWEPDKGIISLGQELFRERYQQWYGGANTTRPGRKESGEFSGQLKQMLKDVQSGLRDTALSAIAKIEGLGLTDEDFYMKSNGLFKFFRKTLTNQIKEPSASIQSMLNGEKSILQARHTAHSATEKFLIESAREIIRLRMDENGLLAISDNLHEFGVLNELYETIRKITGERNLFLLADSSLFLKQIIAGNPTPFVFEKAGNHFDHFMLDEFQDTSGFQWENFRPLIHNSLSGGFSNLVVGDVKQSIYRFRNSDWQILSSQIGRDFRSFSPRTIPLDTNYRSAPELVEFNNRLFSALPGLVSAEISSICGNEYQDIAQRWSGLVQDIFSKAPQRVADKNKDQGGFVSCSFREEKTRGEYEEWLPEALMPVLRNLQDRGWKASDICFLVRKSAEGQKLAEMLLQESEKPENASYNFKIISNESLFLYNNPGVRFLTGLMKRADNPGDEVNNRFILSEYLGIRAGNQYGEKEAELLFTEEGNLVLKEITDQTDRLRSLPLYELTGKLISVFELEKEEGNLPYLMAFRQVVLDFERDETSDLHSFLEYWEEYGSAKTLAASETQDAMRILTIHKAKGLEFRIVIVPFCNWSLKPESGHQNYLWLRPPSGLDKIIPMVPVVYKEKLKFSSLAPFILEETFQSFIDNLNLLYVTFTRARNELHCFSKIGSKSRESLTGIADLLLRLLHSLAPGNAREESQGSIHFRFGESGKPGYEGQKLSMLSKPLRAVKGSQPFEVLSLNSRNAYLLREMESFDRQIGYGTVMHELLSLMRNVSDLDPALDTMIRQGKIHASGKDEIRSALLEKLGREPVSRWFSGSFRVRNEQEFIAGDRKLKRPDRIIETDGEVVVVDFKFGLSKRPAYAQQIAGYKKNLEVLIGKKVSAWIWYYSLDETEEVQ